jgi:hypothetical protein
MSTSVPIGMTQNCWVQTLGHGGFRWQAGSASFSLFSVSATPHELVVHSAGFYAKPPRPQMRGEPRGQQLGTPPDWLKSTGHAGRIA